MEKIAVLPGTHWQIPLIQKLKDMGYFVVNISPYNDSPAFSYADDIIQLDIMDIKGCVRVLKEKNVSAVISDECDIATPVVAIISAELGLNGIGKEIAELFTNKSKMRDFTKRNGFACPDYTVAETKKEVFDFFEKIDKKIIIKPIDSNSSRGVHTILSTKDIDDEFDDAISYSLSNKMVICEEYIDGTEFTVDGIMTNAGHSTLAISEKKHYIYNENIAYSLRFSHQNEKYDYDLLRKINNDLINKTKLSFGLTHVEYKFNNGQFFLIEMGARGGGNLISSDIVPIMSGIDVYSDYINMALGRRIYKLYDINDNYKRREAILYFFDLPEGVSEECIIRKIDGIEYLEKCPNVIRYALNFNIGDKIQRAEDDSKRIGYFIAYGETKEELDDVINNIDKSFRILFEE